MQQSQAEHALTIHVNSSRPNLRIDIDPPSVEERDGELVLTMGLLMIWESTDTKPDSERRTEVDEANEDATSNRMTSPPVDPLFPVSTRFRNWYLCPKDGAEWSIEVDDPTSEDSCPICGATNAATAVLRLPLDTRPRPQETKSKLTLCKGLGRFNRN